MAGIQLRDVSKRYPDGYEAVRHLDLEIADGEFMVLVGPSGCGKTTALRMIAGLEDITDGELVLDGAVVNDEPARDRDIAMVFQNYALYPHMTVARNMAYGLKLAGIRKDERERRVRDAARVLDLEAHLDRKPGSLSGGQRQRVAMGRAIVREPKAFLMDEPLSNLDAKLRVQMRAELSQLQARLGVTTVYVTHDQTEAMTLGDRVAVMRAGVLQQVGTPQALYTAPSNLFVAGFIGSPAMNLLPATVGGGRITCSLGAVSLPEHLRTAPDGPAVLGFRPEHVSAAADDRGLRFTATAGVVEALGSDVFVHLEHDAAAAADELRGAEGVAALDELPGLDPSQIVVRLSGDATVRAGDRLDLAVDATRLHLFDRAGGAAIGVREREGAAA
jgi:multiple sugar transport system ATP-binding protein